MNCFKNNFTFCSDTFYSRAAKAVNLLWVHLLHLVFLVCIRNMEKMSRVTTALSSSAVSGRTMFCHLDAPANAISVCRDATQVVVAGRNIFKIYALEEEQFVEKLNLRVGRKPSLNFSCADVMWHQMEENLLATAATNGAVVTWNLGKPSRNKQDQLFTEHKRTVNKVCFHPTEVYMLLSGSQDGFMKCFDLRKKESVSTFSGTILFTKITCAKFNFPKAKLKQSKSYTSSYSTYIVVD